MHMTMSFKSQLGGTRPCVLERTVSSVECQTARELRLQEHSYIPQCRRNDKQDSGLSMMDMKRIMMVRIR